jgi:hypothetical protein
MKRIGYRRTSRIRRSSVLGPELLEPRIVLSSDLKPAPEWLEPLKSPEVTRSISPSEVVVAMRGVSSITQLAAIPAFAPGRLLASRVDFAASTRLGDVDGLTLFTLSLTPGSLPQQTIDALQSLTCLAWASPNYIYQGNVQDFTPNDPRYGEQYHHPLMANNLAWDLTLGDPSVIIAVLDDGVDIDHADLAPNIWVNDDPIDGIDNDGNGFIDDLHGWDFADNDNNPDAVAGGDHGTHVAGIAAGRTHNALGIAGTAGAATIMPIRFYRYDNTWTSTVIFNSYQYAANNGARIVSVSYNVDGFVGDPTFEAALNLLNSAGVLYLNSAGNNGQLNPPRATYDQGLFVASTTSTDAKSGFSNYGYGIDIASPGSSILSTTPNNTYAVLSGTSMATPNAAGVAALIMSARPTLTRDQVAALLVGTADNIDAQNPAYIGLLGGGRTNSYRAVTENVSAPRIRGVLRIAEGAIITPIANISFDLAHVIDPAAANNPANYRLIGDGPDNLFGTSDDVQFPLALAKTVYYGTNRIRLNLPGYLPEDRYRFIIKDTLVDPFGQALDGDADGSPGGDFVREFTVIAAEPNDSIPTAISTGMTQFGVYSSLAVIGDGAFGNRDVDLYRIETPPNALIRATTAPQDSGLELNSYLRLFDASGNQLAANDNVGADPYAALAFFSPGGGTFYIGVSGAPNTAYDPHVPNSGVPGATGDYELIVETRFATPDAEGDDLTSALTTGVGPGPTASTYSRVAQIGNGLFLDADVDLYRFQATAGQTLNLWTGFPAGGTTSMDTILRLFDASGNELEWNDDFGSSLYSRIANFIIPATGTYYVGVSGYENFDYDPNLPGTGVSGSTGDYELFIQLTIAVEDPEGDALTTAFQTGIGPGRLPNPFVRTAAIGDGLYASRDVDLYRFEASAGQTVTLATERPAGGTSMDTMLRLFDAAGNQLAIDDDSGPGVYSLISNFAITQTGVYYVGVSGYNNSAYNPNIPNSGSQGSTGDYTLTISKVSPTLRVLSTQLFDSGVKILFNTPIQTSNLSLYDIQSGAIGPPDLTLADNASQPIRGSLIPAPDGMSVTFLASSGTLPSGFLTLTLRSAPDAFADTTGDLLDGDGNGSPGGNYVTELTYLPSGSYTLSVPNIIRGPGQSLGSAPDVADFPIDLSNGSNVGRVDLTLRYDPALLSITQAILGPTVPANWSIQTSTPGPGQFRITAMGLTPLPAGALTIFKLAANVPQNAPYASKHMLEFTNISVGPPFGGSFTTRVDNGLAIVAYPGDLNASGTISAADVTALRRVIALLDGGFGAFQMADPQIVGDFNNSGSATAADVTVLRRFLTGLSQNSIPPIPGGITIIPSGLDPLISIPQDLDARPGDRIHVPVLFAQTDQVPISLASLDIAIAFDPRFLTLIDVAPGDFGPHDEFLVDRMAIPGLAAISMASMQPLMISPGESGILAWMTFQITPNARPGATLALNLLDHAATPARGVIPTLANDGALLLLPAPTNAHNDPVDGRIHIRSRGSFGKPLPAVDIARINPAASATRNSLEAPDAQAVTPTPQRPRRLLRALSAFTRRHA